MIKLDIMDQEKLNMEENQKKLNTIKGKFKYILPIFFVILITYLITM